MYIPAWPSLSPAYFIKKDVGGGIPFPLQSSGKKFFYVARCGIYHLMRTLNLGDKPVVLAPDYHHGNEIYAMKAAGVTLRYYPVQRNLAADLDAIEKLCTSGPRPRVLYVTHFIGWPQPMKEIQQLCVDKDLMLIEDCALSFMSEFDGKPLGAFGAYSVFCLYKSLPLPNGGVLVQNDGGLTSADNLQPCSGLSVAGRTAELMLHWVRSRSDPAGRALFAAKRTAGRALDAGKVHRVPVGDTGFDLSTVNVGMSRMCRKLLPSFQYDSIKESRRRNFKIVEERLRGKVALIDRTLSDGVCPLFFPLLARDKHAAATALAQRGIGTVEFWNQGDREGHPYGADAEFLRRHLLEVPIHQDVTADAADYMAEQILRLGIGLGAKA